MIELLIAFAISTVLAGAIYLFYINFVTIDSRTRAMVDIDRNADLFLEQFYKDLRSAEEVIALHNEEIVFLRRKLPRGEITADHINVKAFERVSYHFGNEKNKFFIRKYVGGAPTKKEFQAHQGSKHELKAYVLCEKDNFTYKEFDTVTQSSSDLSRIALLSISLQLQAPKLDRPLKIQTKVSLPNVRARLIQADWNES